MPCGRLLLSSSKIARACYDERTVKTVLDKGEQRARKSSNVPGYAPTNVARRNESATATLARPMLVHVGLFGGWGPRL